MLSPARVRGVMSADNRTGDVSIPLRNLLNSVQCLRDRVCDGEASESDGTFNLLQFWETLNQSVKVVSQEATKLSLAFSKPPLPSQEGGAVSYSVPPVPLTVEEESAKLTDAERLSESILKSVLTLSTVYYWLPKSQGVSLRRQVRNSTVEVLEGVSALVEVILSSPLQSLSQEQLTSTGGVWSACDQFPQLPADNKAAVLVLLSNHTGVVKDALEEIQEALSEVNDPFSDVLEDDVDGLERRGNQDTYWSERDRSVIAPCLGLMKAAAACLRKLISAVKNNGDVSSLQNLAQLDDLADITKDISPSVDDLALCLYPPMDYSGVESNMSKLGAVLRKVLEITRSSHVCGEPELTWVQFLEGAVDHNLQKAADLIHPHG